MAGRIDDIICRPSIIEERSRIDDYKEDAIIDKGHQGMLVTQVD